MIFKVYEVSKEIEREEAKFFKLTFISEKSTRSTTLATVATGLSYSLFHSMT
jgi:hypothetical protein